MMKNCTYCAEFGRQNPQSPTPIQIPLCIPDLSLPPLSKRLVYSESNYRGDHEFFLLPLPQSNSSIHITFQGRIMEHTQGHQYCMCECLTAGCKAFSLANVKGTGTNDWVIRSLDD